MESIYKGTSWPAVPNFPLILHWPRLIRKVSGMVLLPRYSGRMIKDVFSAEVLLSSTEDALAVTVEGENGTEATEHFKFKTCSGKNLGNKAIYGGAGNSSRD